MPVSTVPIGVTASTEKFSEWLLRDNNGNTRIDAIVTLLNQLEVNQGTLISLNTTAKGDLVSAINELLAAFQSGTLIQQTTGLLADLTATSKTNLVAAINELDGDIGVLATLSTTAKTNLVAAINELDVKAGNVGDLSALTTLDRTNLVAAINELRSGLGNHILLSTVAKNATDAINELDSSIGDLTNLSTADKTTLVAAINEVLSTASSNYIKIDGTSTISASIPLNNNRLTGLANGVDPQDAVALSQIGALTGGGDLNLLNTNDKSDLVSAINEVITETVARTSSTGSAVLPAGNTAQRDVIPADGYLRFNSTSNKPEVYANSAWNEINYGAVTGSIYTDSTIEGDGTVGDPFSNRAATTSATGILEIATDAEAIAGALAFHAIVPSSLKATLDAGGFINTDATITGDGTTGSPFTVRTASTTVTGISERATQTEVNAGVDTTRFVTPATLASRTATTARSGVVELATGTETATGTDTAKAVTPAGLLSRTATTARSGVVELATDTETATGTDTAKAVTPAGVAAAIAAQSGGATALTDIGSFITASVVTNSNEWLSAGQTIAGSALNYSGMQGGSGSTVFLGTPSVGTWRCHGRISLSSTNYLTLFQRIA